MTTPEQITRCCLSDFGSSADALKSAAKYCDQIAANAALNPWADSSDAPNYARAAEMLRAKERQALERIYLQTQARDSFYND